MAGALSSRISTVPPNESLKPTNDSRIVRASPALLLIRSRLNSGVRRHSSPPNVSQSHESTLPKWHGMTSDSAALRKQLRHVYWIGGGSGAGKSTIAHRIAAQHGLRLYATDDVMADHARRSTGEDSPLLHRFMAMDMDERWVNRSPNTMLETFHWFQGEGFNLIIEDLLSLPREPGVIVEGFRLLPRLLEPLLSAPAHAVWLLPTPG